MAHIGRRVTLGMAREAIRGTAVNPTHWIPQATLDFDAKIESARAQEGMGIIADSTEQFVTQQYGSGSIEAELRDKALGLVMCGALGAAPTSALVEAGVYDHTYTLSNTNEHTSLSILAQNPDSQEDMFAKVMIDNFSMIIEPVGIVRYTMDFMSNGKKDWEEQTEDFTSLGNKFLHQDASFKLAADVGSLTAASKIDIKRLELNISKNVLKQDGIGSVQPQDILNQQFSIEGTVDIDYESETYRNYMLNGTYRAMEIRLTSKTLIGAASYPTLVLRFPRVDFTEWEQDRSLDDIVVQTVPFKCNYDATNALDIISTATLRNEDVSY